MVYLPTFTINFCQMQVNMSYMDLMGTGFFQKPPQNGWFGSANAQFRFDASASNMSNLAKSCCRCTIRVPPVPWR